jgi:hypothetical protein
MPDTGPETPYVKALFTIDARDESDVFDGYDHPDKHWNGWAMPWFDKAAALKVIAWLNQDDNTSDSTPVFTWEDDVLIATETHDGTDYVNRMEPDAHGR